jgi:hypothetical protein
LFSDRPIDGSQQPFALGKADSISLYITQAISPQVKITLLTHSNAVVTFSASCSSDGVLHGSTVDTDFLIALQPATIIP